MANIFDFELRPSCTERAQDRVRHFVSAAFAIPVPTGDLEQRGRRGDDDAAHVSRLFGGRVSPMLVDREVQRPKRRDLGA